MNCQELNSEKPNLKLADLLLDPELAPAALREHVAQCAECARELAELRNTMGLLDDWAVPEANPFFDAKLLSRLRSEEQSRRVGFAERFLERWRARFVYGSSLRMQPLMAGALGVVLLIGGGAFADLSWQSHHQTEESAAVRDLQSLDGNAQVFQQLDSVDQSTAQDDDSGPSGPSSD
jgi:anti-sigma factor RsiW